MQINIKLSEEVRMKQINKLKHKQTDKQTKQNVSIKLITNF